MQLSLIIAPLICITLYSAQAPTQEESDGRLRSQKKQSVDEWLSKHYNADPEVWEQFQHDLTERTTRELARKTAHAYIFDGKQVPAHILLKVDPETARLAHQHNQIIQQLSQKEQSK